MKKLEQFLNKFPIYKGNKKKPYIILFDAYIGMGKSTISKIISKLDGSIILNNDEVKYYFNIYDDSKLIYDLQFYRLKELLKNNNSCIFDCNLSKNKNKKLDYLTHLGYDYYIIRLECSDEIIKTRLSNRKIDEINYSLANFEDYLEMKKNIPKIKDELISYTINTENDLEIQIKDFLNKYNLI